MATPYYQDEYVTLYHGDALVVLGDAGVGDFDLAFADPPYNCGLEYDGFADDMPADEYSRWCGTWFALLRLVASAVIVTPGHGNLPTWFEVAKPHGVGCWFKPGGTGSSFLGWCEWEPWLYWGKRLGGGDVIRATLNPSFKGDVGHPCPKPELLIEGLLRKTKASSVIDPFAGSGTTLAVAKRLGLRAVGIEQSERYCRTIAARLGSTEHSAMHDGSLWSVTP